MAVVDALLPKLRRVKAMGPDCWVACCPAHQDRMPSLRIRETDDGLVLIHCFAGCEPLAILEALGLTFQDVFPEPLSRTAMKRLRAPFSPMDVLECIRREAAVIAIAASDIAEGKTLSPEDARRVALAADRIAEALEAVYA